MSAIITCIREVVQFLRRHVLYTLLSVIVAAQCGAGAAAEERALLTFTGQVPAIVESELGAPEEGRYEVIIATDEGEFAFELEDAKLLSDQFREVHIKDSGIFEQHAQHIHLRSRSSEGSGFLRLSLLHNGDRSRLSIQGLLSSQGGYYSLSSLADVEAGALRDSIAIELHTLDVAELGQLIDEDLHELPEELRGNEIGDESGQTVTGSSAARPLRIATEADHEFTWDEGGAARANAEIQAILNAVAGIYEDQVNIRLVLTHQRAWESSEDPYVEGRWGDTDNELRNSYRRDIYPYTSYDRILMWTGRNLNYPGVSYAGVAFGITAIQRRFGGGAKITLAAHELGHTCGAQHDPDRGSIMYAWLNDSRYFSEGSRTQLSSAQQHLQAISAWNDRPLAPVEVQASQGTFADRVSISAAFPVGGGYIEEFELFRSTRSERCTGAPIKRLPTHITRTRGGNDALFDEQVPQSSDYFYSLRSTGPGGASECSEVVRGHTARGVPLAPPSGRSYIYWDSERSEVTWSGVCREAAATHVEVDAANSPLGPWTRKASVPCDQFGTDTRLVFGMAAHGNMAVFRIRLCNQHGCGAYQDPIVRTLSPGTRQPLFTLQGKLLLPDINRRIYGMQLYVDGGALGGAEVRYDGNYSFNVYESPIHYNLKVGGVGEEIMTLPAERSGQALGSTTGLDFTITAAPVSGLITTDAPGNPPIEGAQIFVNGVQRAVTDAAGRFKVPLLPTDVGHTISARAQGIAIDPYSIRARSPGQLSFRGYPAVRLSGVVTSEGRGVPNLELSLRYLETYQSFLINTDALGRFDAGYVKQGARVSVGLPLFGSGYRLDPENVELVLSQDTHVAMTAVASPLSGKITVGPNGPGLGEVKVERCTRGERRDCRTQYTDQFGSYHFPQTPHGEELEITVQKDGYAFSPMVAQGQMSLNRRQNFVAAAGREMQLRLVPAPRYGTIIPLEVLVGGVSQGTIGAYDGMRMHVPAGRSYKLVPRSTHYGFAPAELIGMANTSPIIAQFETVASPLRGKVRTMEAPLSLVRIAAGAFGTVFSDQNGDFEIPRVPHGASIELMPSKAGYGFSPNRIQRQMAFGESAYFTAGAPARLLGRVTMNGVGIGGVRVDGGALGAVLTDAQGNFSFGYLYSSTNFRLTPSKEGYRFTPESVAATLNGDTRVDFSGQGTLTLSGWVVAAGGVGVKNALVHGGILGQVQTNERGYYQFEGLPAGLPYQIRVAKPGYSFEPAQRSGTSNTSVTQVNFSAISSPLTGIVTSGGAALANARVHIAPLDQIRWTDSRGNYRFDDLPHGTALTITTSKPGFRCTPLPLNVVMSFERRAPFVCEQN